MSKLPKPGFASFSTGKAFLTILYGTLLIVFMVWLSRAIIPLAHDKPVNLSLSVADILLGGGILPIAVYERWAWKSRRRNASWHRWLGRVAIHLYLSLLALVGSVAYWNAILDKPWSLFVNGAVIAGFALASTLPAMAYSLAKSLLEKQDLFSLKLLTIGSPLSLMVLGGVFGASQGLQGPSKAKFVALAFLLAFIGIGLAQYSITYFWPYRPWAKDEQ